MDKIISRGTKAFSAFHGTDLQGAYPKGFLNWVKNMGWWGEKRIHLCSGRVVDEGSFKVDIRQEMKPDLIADATNTGLTENSFDAAFIDPPYSKELAKKLYGTDKEWKSINAFTKEAVRLVSEGGIICTLTYEIPKIPKGADLIAVWGVYTIPHTSFMRCFTVFKKKVLKDG